MKTLCLMITSLSIVCIAATASHSASRWAKTYGKDKLENVFSMDETSDNKYILAGFTNSIGAGFCDYWLLKLDDLGNVSWQKIYGGSSLDRAFSIRKTNDDGYIVAGVTSSFDVGSYDIWILKLDSNGDILWQKTYGGSNSEWNIGLLELLDIEQTTDEGYIVASHTSSFGAGGYDIWILKLNSDGTINWQKTYGGEDDEYAISIKETSDTGYIVSGYTNSFGAGNNDIWVLKLDNTGNVSWQKTYGGGGNEQGRYIQEEGMGYVVGGFTDSFGAGGGDIWILKLNYDGTVNWQKTYGAIGGVEFGGRLKTLVDGYIVVGRTFSCGAGEGDNLVLKLNSDGTINWQKTYGGSNSEWIPSILQTFDGGYIMASSTSSFGAGGDDYWVLKFDSNGEIPGCDVIGPCDALVTNTTVEGQDTNATIQTTSATVSSTDITPQAISAEINVVCECYDPDDYDCDDVLNNQDNCPDTPNGLGGGTCTSGTIGESCMGDVYCGDGGFCSMNQEDTYPPLGNEIGDACDCESDFSCDGDVDAEDVTAFLSDFGRGQYSQPCTNGDLCNGDFSCDGDVDATDVTKFLEDFGRGQYSNPCPACVEGDWCVY